MNFEKQRLYNLTFCGGPACGKSYRVARVMEKYEHEDEGGDVYLYEVEPSKRLGWGYSAVCVGHIGEVRA